MDSSADCRVVNVNNLLVPEDTPLRKGDFIIRSRQLQDIWQRPLVTGYWALIRHRSRVHNQEGSWKQTLLDIAHGIFYNLWSLLNHYCDRAVSIVNFLCTLLYYSTFDLCWIAILSIRTAPSRFWKTLIIEAHNIEENDIWNVLALYCYTISSWIGRWSSEHGLLG